VNVYRLGRAFVRLVEEENLRFEPVDPTLFIDRIINKLPLSAAAQQPQKLATIKLQCAELIKMAKKVITSDIVCRGIRCIFDGRLFLLLRQDWLVPGRAPTAVAAAAVSLALSANHVQFDLKVTSANLHVAER
jgi:transcription initiation factor TFIIIB Brf1 subunit/transcription initiation factor TFIIB